MSLSNKAILIGNLGADAELRVSAGGENVLRFSVATSEKFKNKAGEQQESTQWHRCVMFGERAGKIAQYLTKGTKVAVEGAIQYGSYEKDGQKVYTTDIKAFNVEFLGGGSKQSDAAEPTGEPEAWDGAGVG
jgi:single-strand DNA-binding protein